MVVTCLRPEGFAEGEFEHLFVVFDGGSWDDWRLLG